MPRTITYKMTETWVFTVEVDLPENFVLPEHDSDLTDDVDEFCRDHWRENAPGWKENEFKEVCDNANLEIETYPEPDNPLVADVRRARAAKETNT